MKIYVNRPDSWIIKDKSKPNAYWYKDLEAFYNNIEIVLKELNIIPIFTNNPAKDCIFINHHSRGNTKNIWHVKKGYVPGYLYFDKTGYSGWSEGAIRYNPKKVYSKELLDKTKELMQYYIESNISKIKQPDFASIPEGKYILVTGQKPGDTVEQLAIVKTKQLSVIVNRAFKDSDYAVYTKPHPEAKIKYKVPTITGSLHKLIANASAIYTVNSGSGFEALFHNKRIFISGKTDYSPVVNSIGGLYSINETKYLIEETPSLDSRVHFLTYCFNEHFVDAYSKDSIKRKVLRAINEYEC